MLWICRVVPPSSDIGTDNLLEELPTLIADRIAGTPLLALAVSSLVSTAADTAFCLALISLELAKSRILYTAPADMRSRTSLISFCTIQPRTLCAARSLETVSQRPLTLRRCPASGAPWSSAMLPFLRRCQATTTTTTTRHSEHTKGFPPKKTETKRTTTRQNFSWK